MATALVAGLAKLTEFIFYEVVRTRCYEHFSRSKGVAPPGKPSAILNCTICK